MKPLKKEHPLKIQCIYHGVKKLLKNLQKRFIVVSPSITYIKENNVLLALASYEELGGHTELVT